jgi:hypothetical protein
MASRLPPLVGPGANVKFYTPSRFLDRSDNKELGTRIANLDKMARDTITIADKTCPGLEAQTAALGRLDFLGRMYADFIDDLARDKVSQTSDLFRTVSNSMDSVIHYKTKLAADIQDCINRKVYSDLNNAMVTNSHAEANRTGRADDKEEAAIRAKIKRSKLINPCGFRGFEDYAGGVAYKKFFEDYMTSPFELKNYDAEVKGTLGTMLFGPPGTGKTLLAEAVAKELQRFGSAFYSITASTIKGKVCHFIFTQFVYLTFCSPVRW